MICLITQAVAMSIPGQNHILLAGLALISRFLPLYATIGIASSGVVLSTAAMATVMTGTVIWHQAYELLSIGAAGFLLIIAFSKLRHAVLSLNRPQRQRTKPKLQENVSDSRKSSAFALGFMLNLSNPATIAVLGSLFIATLPIQDMSGIQAALVVFAAFLNSLVIHGLAGLFYSMVVEKSGGVKMWERWGIGANLFVALIYGVLGIYLITRSFS